MMSEEGALASATPMTEPLPAPLQDMMLRNYPAEGAADIYCMGPPNLERMAEQVSVLLGMSHEEERPVEQVVIVRPPMEAGDAVDDEMLQAISAQIASDSGEGATPELDRWLARRISIIRTASLGLDALMTALPPPAAKLAVIVASAGRYRAMDLQVQIQPGLGQPENIWCPHLTRLAERCVDVAKSRSYYVLIDAGEDPPFRPHNQALLQSVGDCGVITGSRPGSPDEMIADRAVTWLNSIRSGRVGAVIAEIDQLAFSEQNKSRLKIQMLSHGGLHAAAMQMLLAELNGPAQLSAESAMAYALVARRAHDDEQVSRLVGFAAPRLVLEEHLETALRLAHEVGDQDVEAIIAERLAERYPQSTGLLEHRLMQSRGAADYQLAANLLQARGGGREREEQFYRWLAARLAMQSVDYLGCVEALATNWGDLAGVGRIALARHAERAGAFDVGLYVLLSPGPDAARDASEVKFLIHLAEQRLLRRREDDEDLEEELAAVVMVGAAYLASTPNDPVVRTRLGRMLSVETSGSIGRVAAMFAILELMEEEPELVPEPPSEEPEPEVDDLGAILPLVVDWFRAEPLVSVGRMTFPAERLPAGFNPRIGSRLLAMVDQNGDTVATEHDVRGLLINVAMVAALAPHTSDPTLDLAVMKLAGVKLILANRRQQARDLIEGVLEIAETRPERRRAAWFAYADVYHRTGDTMEALLAMTCGLACRTPISAAQAWYEAIALVRLMRDLGATPFARQMIERARRRLAFMGQDERYASRLQTMSLMVEYNEFSVFGRGDRERLEALVAAMAKNCRLVLSEDDEVAPIATLLAQVVRMARAQAVSLPDGIEDLIEEAIGRVGGPLATKIRTFAAKAPDVVDLVQLSQDLEAARYSSDAGFDIAHLSILARRFLTTVDATTDARSVAFAIEILADQAAVRHDESGQSLAPAQPDALESPFAAAEQIARDGLGVVLLGIDEDSRLVRVCVEAEGARNSVEGEADDVFSNKSFREWSATFPYGYGSEEFEEDKGNMFLNSMRHIGVSALPPERSVMIMDTALQTLPPNLIKVGDEFASKDRPVALAPSLSWLSAARLRRHRAAGPARAWISTAAPGEVRATLAAMAERLDLVLREHGIPMDTQAEIPGDFAGAEMAIVGAHGGIHLPDGRYFNSVADEDELVAPARALARALADVKVVVLMVCSGGRLDASPGAHTTVGLAKQLLDQGCSTVIGSPWPLAWNVPVFWLPEFLDAWRLGTPIIDANFLANAAVRRNLRDTTDVGLAMSVYGDPLVQQH